MAEPVTTTAGSVTAAISVVTLALLGVDYYSLLYGLVGALMGLSQSAAMARFAAVVHIFMSTILGAAFGNAALAMFSTTSRPLLIMGCLIGGAGAQLIVSASIKAVLARIALFGGGAGTDGRLPNQQGSDDSAEGDIRNGR